MGCGLEERSSVVYHLRSVFLRVPLSLTTYVNLINLLSNFVFKCIKYYDSLPHRVVERIK